MRWAAGRLDILQTRPVWIPTRNSPQNPEKNPFAIQTATNNSNLSTTLQWRPRTTTPDSRRGSKFSAAQSRRPTVAPIPRNPDSPAQNPPTLETMTPLKPSSVPIPSPRKRRRCRRKSFASVLRWVCDEIWFWVFDGLL